MQPIDSGSQEQAMPEALIGQEQQARAQARGLLRTFSALRHRNYRLFFFGQMISQIGTWMQTTAQAWLILELTHSALLLGLVGVLQFLPVMVFSLFGGVLADRVPKRTLLLVTQSVALIQAVVFLSFSHHRKITLEDPQCRLPALFCQLVGNALFFCDGWFLAANVKDGKAQEGIRLTCGHLPFDDHVAVLIFPKDRAPKVPLGLDVELGPTGKLRCPLSGLLTPGKYIPDVCSRSSDFDDFFYKQLWHFSIIPNLHSRSGGRVPLISFWIPEWPFQTNPCKNLSHLIWSGSARLNGQAILIPGQREIPQLVEIDTGPPGKPASLTPLSHYLFRPEEQHGRSGVKDVIPPLCRWHRKMDDT